MNRSLPIAYLLLSLVFLRCGETPKAKYTDPIPSRWENLLDALPDWEWKDTLNLIQLERLRTEISYAQAFHFWIIPAAPLRDTLAQDFQHTFLITPGDLANSHTWAGKDTVTREPILVHSEYQMGELYAAGKVKYQTGDWGIVWMLRTSHPILGIGTRTWIARYDSLGTLADYAPFIEDLANDYGNIRRTQIAVKNDSISLNLTEVNRNNEIPGQPIQIQLEQQLWRWNSARRIFLPEE